MTKTVPILRKSWIPKLLWIIAPVHIKSKALNKAWITRWKKATCTFPKERVTHMNPNCPRVEYATIRFISYSCKAEIPAIKTVVREINNNHSVNVLSIIKS